MPQAPSEFKKKKTVYSKYLECSSVISKKKMSKKHHLKSATAKQQDQKIYTTFGTRS